MGSSGELLMRTQFNIFVQENQFENDICNILTILSGLFQDDVTNTSSLQCGFTDRVKVVVGVGLSKAIHLHQLPVGQLTIRIIHLLSLQIEARA